MGDDAADARVELEHDFLDNAKIFDWASVKAMLGENPDLINAQPSGRWSALHQAAFEGNGDMATFLIEKGANPAAVTGRGQTPLQVAKGGAKELLKRSAPAAEEAEEAADGQEEEADETVDDGAAEPKKKKAKKAKKPSAYALNINNAVDKEYEHCSFKEIAAAPTSALQGIAEKGKAALKKLGIKTIRDLGTWKFYRMAKAIAGLSALEIEGGRDPSAALNINKAMDKKHEAKSLAQIVDLPPSALQGLAGWVDAEFAALHVKTIGALGVWKFAQWSEWIVDLADYEAADFSS